MLHVVTTGAYYPPVVTTWKILTTGVFQLTAVSLCSGLFIALMPLCPYALALIFRATAEQTHIKQHTCFCNVFSYIICIIYIISIILT